MWGSMQRMYSTKVCLKEIGHKYAVYRNKCVKNRKKYKLQKYRSMQTKFERYAQ